MRNDFDSGFRKAKVGIGIGLIIKTIFGIAILVGSIWLVVHAVNEVNEKGLKSIIEEVWEGPDED